MRGREKTAGIENHLFVKVTGKREKLSKGGRRYKGKNKKKSLKRAADGQREFRKEQEEGDGGA